ncbi:MAG: hypothetical protein APF82_00870 [Sphingomonadales bacterium BRH_c42]|nr:MAG: hypothetical protein APF82_00870 [Sphingomonadales bacterium BRH_c42]
MSHLKPIYAVWDHNAEAMASDIGEPGVKVRQWRNRGNIPAVYWQRIIDAALRIKGQRLDLSQFIPPDPAPVVTPERIIVCDVCDRRVDEQLPKACTFVDCPHSQRAAA